MELREETKSYLLRFLTGYEDESVFRHFRIGYTADPELFSHYNLVFIPSGFFDNPFYGKVGTLPCGELPEIEGVPFLYGSGRVKKAGDTVLVYADLVATAFFFLSRYEEICRRDVRDAHGRFPGKESLLFRNQLIFRPILDEYPALVRKWLRDSGVELPAEVEPKIAKLWLTHDVDAPFYCQSPRAVLRETFRGKGPVTALKLYFRKPEEDPYYTFPWLIEQDENCRRGAAFPVQAAYFFKAPGDLKRDRLDRPFYGLKSRKIRRLYTAILKAKAIVGLHGSYVSGAKRADVAEKRHLERAFGKKVFFFRNHYLRSCEPEHFHSLENMGITDDFTMGYADVAGFRLATSRPVVWIDPKNGRLSSLVLHPLIVMDNTLSDYMGLDEETARKYCTMLFHAVKKYGGELCLLWHNQSVSDSGYPAATTPWLRSLYVYLLDYLSKM